MSDPIPLRPPRSPCMGETPRTVPLAEFLRLKAALRLARVALDRCEAELAALARTVKRGADLQEAALGAVGREKRARMTQAGFFDSATMSDVEFGGLLERVRMIADP